MDQTNFAQSKVPKENLLVWNVKEGWGPLCEFLGKPIPDGPIPHDNKTGDKKFFGDYLFKSNFMKVSQILVDSKTIQTFRKCLEILRRMLQF